MVNLFCYVFLVFDFYFLNGVAMEETYNPTEDRDGKLKAYTEGLFSFGFSYEEVLESAILENTLKGYMFDREWICNIVKEVYNKGVGANGRTPPLIYNPTPISGDELLSQPDDDIPWLIEELIPRGSVTMIAGTSGVGKTWIALLLAQAISEGAPFLSRQSRKAMVIYFDLESPKAILRKRLNCVKARNVRFVCSWFPASDFNLWAECLDRMAKEGYVIIIDSLVRAHDKEENSAMEMSKVMKRLRELANMGATILFLHHRGKSETIKFRGSSDISAGVDVAYVLEKRNGYLVLDCIKNRLAKEEKILMTLEITPEDAILQTRQDELEEKAEQAEDEYMNVIENAIRELTEAGTKPTREEVYKALNGSVGINGLQTLLKKGYGIRWVAEKYSEDKRSIYYVLV